MNLDTLRLFKQQIRHRLNLFFRRSAVPVPIQYANIRLSDEDIVSEAYKLHLGGGKEQWDKRGRFQLLFLESMGMLPSSRLLDIGCGPLRAGTHLIEYLEAGHYFGFDCNADFVAVAKTIAEKRNLLKKRPFICQTSNFDCTERPWTADFAIAFSVLNHCSEIQKRAFFRIIPDALSDRARLYITHANWLRPDYLGACGLIITRTINSSYMDITLHGWEHREDIFPILELTKTAPAAPLLPHATQCLPK
jgi:SAM-dependent methyltransferase